MHGVGTAFGAITFVNALTTGVGASGAIDLPVEASIDLDPLAPGASGTVSVEPEVDTPLARAAIARGLAQFHGPGPFAGRLRVRSDVPPSRGLKSSSAVSAAILAATASASGTRPPAAELARLSAEVSQAIGLSAT
ncbi:MAG: hypothetical protein ACREEC_12595, partial [Thermoplasmata archaeon]